MPYQHQSHVYSSTNLVCQPFIRLRYSTSCIIPSLGSLWTQWDKAWSKANEPVGLIPGMVSQNEFSLALSRHRFTRTNQTDPWTRTRRASAFGYKHLLAQLLLTSDTVSRLHVSRLRVFLSRLHVSRLSWPPVLPTATRQKDDATAESSPKA